MGPNERYQHAMAEFSRVSLAGWSLDNHGQQSPQGGQSGVCTVTSERGDSGVFRCLPPAPALKAIERFQREVKVLSEISHPNVMRLLEYSLEAPYWYISPKGINLKSYWNARRGEEGCSYFEDALKIARGVAAGLDECHCRGIVHRDVKPNNIVVYEGRGEISPALIDFGVVWVEDEERLTALDEAVGNAQYSSDGMRHRREHYVPWDDVFMLAQVLLWLAAQKDVKHFWQRPVHWRYVVFSKNCPEWIANALRALAAATSIEELAPRDASAFLGLMDSLFIPPVDDSGSTSINQQAIKSGLAVGAAKKLMREAADREVLLAAKAAAVAFANTIQGVFLEAVDGDHISLVSESRFHDLYSPSKKLVYGNTCVELRCGSHQQAFEVTLKVHAYLPSFWERQGKEPPSALQCANPFLFYLTRYGRARNFPNDTHVISLENDGRMLIRKEDLTPVATTTFEEIRKLVAALISDKAAWSAMAEAD